MKNYTLLLSCLVFFCSPLFAQVPFQGMVTTNIQPIKNSFLQQYINVVYHNSFDGNLKVYINDDLVADKDVRHGEVALVKLGGNFQKSQRAIMKIVLNDLFYLEEVINFHHPFIRIHYQEAERHLAIHFEDQLPKIREMSEEGIREQVDLAIRQRLTDGGGR